jgi:hypothetical protein
MLVVSRSYPKLVRMGPLSNLGPNVLCKLLRSRESIAPAGLRINFSGSLKGLQIRAQLTEIGGGRGLC